MAKVCSPSSNDRENETATAAIPFKLISSKACKLKGSRCECFNDSLDFIVNFFKQRNLGEEVFDKKLNSVRVARDKKDVL